MLHTTFMLYVAFPLILSVYITVISAGGEVLSGGVFSVGDRFITVLVNFCVGIASCKCVELLS